MASIHLLEQHIELTGHCGRIGLEREALRVGLDGHIAQSSHPEVLGSALTHPHITTDYSEALLELVTAPFLKAEDLMVQLEALHRFTLMGLPEGERLWPASMPCVIGPDENIPIARYGNSNEGRLRHIYRKGLGLRYGRRMQVIAGMHFNFSLDDQFWPHLGDDQTARELADRHYFGLVRNLLRHGWLTLYLFGASPAVCASFVEHDHHHLEEFDPHTLYLPYATSLRMSDIGYTNHRSERTCTSEVCHESLRCYIDTLWRATQTVCDDYRQAGVIRNGEYQQLNDHRLQIENEFYTPVRPKQPTRTNERPLRALAQRGVGYLELRTLDLDPFAPLGTTVQQLDFLRLLCWFCLLESSPELTSGERHDLDDNLLQCALRGREPDLSLKTVQGLRPLRELGLELCERMTPIAHHLDAIDHSKRHQEALAQQIERLQDPDRTPSAHVLKRMRADELGYFGFHRRLAETHRQTLENIPLKDLARWQQMGAASWQKQRQIETSAQPPFADYLESWLNQVPEWSTAP